MKRLFLLLALLPMVATARHQISAPNVKSLEVRLNNDFMLQPVMQLGSADVLTIDFDELSHDYHRFVCHLEPCNPDWTPTEGLFGSDWLNGFNDLPIEDYQNSLNTTVLYTHYHMQLPNEQMRVTMSGNYRIYILNDDDDGREVVCVEFRVVEPLVNVGVGVTTNTDVDFQQSHQQVNMTVNLNTLSVTNLEEQIQTMVMQNGREDNMKVNVKPNYVTPRSLQWEHNRQLIFEAGNEYHKFEVLDPTHTTMGLAHVMWDEELRRFNVFPFYCQPQRNYLYDEDADGAFVIRNSDNYEIDYTSDYVYVHYKLAPVRHYADARIFIDGQWTTESPDIYTMTYDDEDQSYNAVIMQKLGYYNYQLLMQDFDGITHRVPEEGSFYQTENRYQAYIYYKGTGARSWRLVGYQEIVFRDK